MNPPLLILRLEGPMQSWGLRGKWVVRDTGDVPTKSGIVGMIGCALGYRRNDPRLVNEIENNIKIGVRIENPGTRVKDFHTVRAFFRAADGSKRHDPRDKSKPYTEVTSRTYLQDASFLVIVESPEALLRKIYWALKDPQWPVYLGRKSCPPTRPVVEEITQKYTSLLDAIRQYPWSASTIEIRGDPKLKPRQLRCLVEDPDGVITMVNREVAMTDRMQINPARMYGIRRVKEFPIDTPSKDEFSCTSQG